MTTLDNEESARHFTAGLCDNTAMGRLDRLAVLLSEENERQNLVARATIPAMWQRHIADSAQLLEARLLGDVPRETVGVWLDLGTGAGFPGLVIAAMRPDWAILLVESRRKRFEWLRHCCDALGLARCEVLGERLEQVATFPTSVISARAFAPLPLLIDLSARFSTADTRWLLPKGRSAALELAQLPKRRRAMFHVEQSLTDPDAGIITGRLAEEARQAS